MNHSNIDDIDLYQVHD